MKKEILEWLRCPDCRKSDWKLEVLTENEREIREGKLKCGSCPKTLEIKGGILDVLGTELPEEVAHEKEHAEAFGYLVTAEGEKCPINRETLDRFRDLFISLPAGDGSHFFKSGGSFDNQAGNAERFFKTLDLLKLKGGDRVLEVGASFGWSAWRFAQRGCSVVALDVTNYLMAADLYFEEDGNYFERVMADMSILPFKDETFDIIFSHSVIHHCKDLGRLFSEFRRVLRPGGRVVALHECAFGILEDKSGKALQEAIHEGFNENAYTVPEWMQGARRGGFKKIKLHFFSFIEDYIYRKKLRGAPATTPKMRLAAWIQRSPFFHGLINSLSVIPRIFLRPKAWMIIASKSSF
ncbi:MAG: class I SAM-dependent methyltransferase [Candidatus Omnitrophica bacterium]|nr:class I SAM-dependent methyltransferase [Candidatus Omnitrophota bacterium]